MKSTMAALLTLVPVSAHAHHSHAAGVHFGIGHFLTDAFHLGILALIVLGVVSLGRFLFRRRPWTSQ